MSDPTNPNYLRLKANEYHSRALDFYSNPLSDHLLEAADKLKACAMEITRLRARCKDLSHQVLEQEAEDE